MEESWSTLQISSLHPASSVCSPLSEGPAAALKTGRVLDFDRSIATPWSFSFSVEREILWYPDMLPALMGSLCWEVTQFQQSFSRQTDDLTFASKNTLTYRLAPGDVTSNQYHHSFLPPLWLMRNYFVTFYFFALVDPWQGFCRK